MTLLCDYCGCMFRNKELLTNHIRIHTELTETTNELICIRCEIKFPNKKLLNRHVAQEHPKKNKKMKKSKLYRKNYKYQCVACHNRFLYNCQLKYHIRKSHFNLISQVPYRDLTHINQVWFEKVLNTNIMVEIKNIGNNHLLLRRLDTKTSVKATEMPKQVIDLRMMYPTESSMKMLQCHACSTMWTKKELTKHFKEKHGHLLKRKCNSCNTSFKHLTGSINHICPRGIVKGG